MSQQRIKSIHIKNFKAFQDLEVNLDGRHLLAYGGNGSGKSSLYWALYTFFQSGSKPTDQVQKYFDPSNPEKLLNIHADAGINGEITLTLQNEDGSATTGYTIAKDQHGTLSKPEILKANLASDFITFRVLFSFYSFTNSQKIDLWSVFEREILPFCRSSVAEDINSLWLEIKNYDPYKEVQRRGLRGPHATARYDRYVVKLKRLNQALDEVLSSISKKAQEFYTHHFQLQSEPTLELEVKLTQPLDYDRRLHKLIMPAIGLGIRLPTGPIKPQTFLNEAKLTQIALSIRFASTLVNLQDSSLKLLVLDDLLISLDMDNRMKIVDIILGEDFAGYQKIILTHNLGFFQELRRQLATDHTKWCFKKFHGTPSTGITLQQQKDDMEQAAEHLHRYELEECAARLRKAAEKTAHLYREWKTGGKLKAGEFHSLTENLRAAKNKLQEDIPQQLYNKILGGLPEEHRDLILPADNLDIDSNPELTPAERGKLKSQRINLRRLIADEHWQVMQDINLLDDILKMTARVLNPASHGGVAPFYESEVQKAFRLIERFERRLISSRTGA